MNVLKIIAVACLSSLLAACSLLSSSYRTFAPDRNTEYLSAEVDPPLRLPEGVYANVNPYSPYALPQGPRPAADAQPLNLVPPGGRALWDQAQAEIAAAGDEA